MYAFLDSGENLQERAPPWVRLEEAKHLHGGWLRNWSGKTWQELMDSVRKQLPTMGAGPGPLRFQRIFRRLEEISIGSACPIAHPSPPQELLAAPITRPAPMSPPSVRKKRRLKIAPVCLWCSLRDKLFSARDKKFPVP